PKLKASCLLSAKGGTSLCFFFFFAGRIKPTILETKDCILSWLICPAAPSEAKSTIDFLSHPAFFNKVLFSTNGSAKRKVLVSQSDLPLTLFFEVMEEKRPFTISTPGI